MEEHNHQVMISIINGHNVYLFEKVTLALSFLDLTVTESGVVLVIQTCTIDSAEPALDYHGKAHFRD